MKVIGTQQPKLLAATDLVGDSVRNPAGEDLGKIEDIMLDLELGRIAYAVLSFGGFLGLGDKLFAIPWDVLTLDTDRKCFVLNVPKERLERAPGFDENYPPNYADRRWGAEIHEYYEQPPYWVR